MQNLQPQQQNYPYDPSNQNHGHRSQLQQPSAAPTAAYRPSPSSNAHASNASPSIMSQPSTLLPPIHPHSQPRPEYHDSVMQQQQQQPPPPHPPPPPPSQQPHQFSPPMLTNGAQIPQQRQPQHHPPYPPPYPPPQAPLQQQHYYANGALPGHAIASSMQDGQNGVRYALPPHAANLAGGMIGPRKTGKEIKRRTKTGCLTCRKRRIKCDEGHPTCRNCQKSKRECLGYDPIFKQQPGPAAIQPAPILASPSSSSPLPATAQQHHQQHAQGHGNPQFGLGDPAAQGHNFDPQYDHSSGVLDPQLAIAQTQYTSSQQPYTTKMLSQRKFKPVAIEQLHMLNDVSPSYQVRDPPPTLAPDAFHEIGLFYKNHYAVGLDKLFETTWYYTRGLQHLHSDPQLQDFVVQCAEAFKSDNSEVGRSRPSLEARLVWQLAIMPRSAAAAAGGGPTTGDQLVQDLLPRIDVVEYLLTGQVLPSHRIPASPQRHDQTQPHPHDREPTGSSTHPDSLHNDQNNPTAAQIYSQLLFWHQLGLLLSLRDDMPDPAIQSQANDCLDTMRGVLHVLESRDVLYSLAIVRHIGGKIESFMPYKRIIGIDRSGGDQPQQQQQQQQQDVEKLEVARAFVEQEDSKGLTQAIQRICGMSVRSWILQKQ